MCFFCCIFMNLKASINLLVAYSFDRIFQVFPYTWGQLKNTIGNSHLLILAFIFVINIMEVRKPRVEVFLNVYDLNPQSNASLYACGLGFYHTGLQL